MEDFFNFDADMDSVLECALDVVMESTDGKQKHVLDSKTRDSLPDNAFGVVYTSETE